MAACARLAAGYAAGLIAAPNKITFNALTSAREKGKQWQRALGPFVEMRSRGLQADVIAYNATISASEKSKQWQRALGLFQEMRLHGLQANAITYNATTSACSKGKQWQRA